MNSEKIALIVLCVFFSLFAMLFTAGFIATTTASYSMDRFTEQVCTFSEYELKVYEHRGSDSEVYYIYVQEYEKPLKCQLDCELSKKSRSLHEHEQIPAIFSKNRCERLAKCPHRRFATPPQGRKGSVVPWDDNLRGL